ncbi:MAG TPA: hypothetical protein VGF28_21860 [Thermoanaerobaculia bacterium]|jgi:hypothetical protein
MKQESASERVVALVQEAVDVLQRAERAPVSPVNTALPRNLKREYRRNAARLRQGKLQPRYANLHTAEQLADIYERTIRRDEILEGVLRDLRRIALNLRGMMETNGDEVNEAIQALIGETRRSMEKDGPGSEAARRYRLMQFLAWSGRQSLTRKRRQKGPPPPLIPVIADRHTQSCYERSAAEVLSSPPSPGEAVIAIPPDGTDFGRGRMFIRIGTGERSWIGSFARGHAATSTIYMMPDDKHLFVSAAGAGYVIEAGSRTLVETVGTEVAGVIRDEPMTLFIVGHKDMSLEAFGRSGRLWKTDAIGSGGFRGMTITDTELFGEARYAFLGTWVGFSVKLATGEVELDRIDD